jgi:hypothetical protein
MFAFLPPPFHALASDWSDAVQNLWAVVRCEVEQNSNAADPQLPSTPRLCCKQAHTPPSCATFGHRVGVVMYHCCHVLLVCQQPQTVVPTNADCLAFDKYIAALHTECPVRIVDKAPERPAH